MTDSSPTSDAAIEVKPYDPAWPKTFAHEREILKPLLAQWLVADIEHVGSTAVPGLVAKPVIDILAAVESLEASRGVIQIVSAAGYMYYPYKAEEMHWFCKPSPAHRTHHLHIVPRSSAMWRENLAFRDALRRDSELAANYGRLKLELAQRFRHDREAYTEAKSSFIRSAIDAHAK
jgi:GrpB-like predicted nucleotidyltransferase (UPF0157 family)